MSTTFPLQRFQVIHSSDVKTVQAAIEDRFCPHPLRLAPGPDRLNARVHAFSLQQVAVHYISYGREVHLGPAKLESFYVAGIPLTGTIDITCGPQQIRAAPGTASILNATEPTTMHWSGNSSQLVVRIERAAIEAQLRRLLHARLPRPVRFRLAMNTAVAPTRQWLTTLQMLVRDLEMDSPLTRSPLVLADTERMLINRLLFAQPHNYRGLLLRQLHDQHDDPARRAIRLIDAAPEAAHTVPGLAQAVGVSVRRLQEIFRQLIGMSPTEYIRSARLERVHNDLLAFDPSQRTVTQIATQWGFNHLGRFASLYRDRYGEHPYRTLHRDYLS